MAEVSWSRCGDADCIRLAGLADLAGLAAGAQPQVRPGTAAAGLPPMAGRLVTEAADLCFIPRFAFLAGTTYTVTVDGAVAATLLRDRPRSAPVTEVTGIYPTSERVPRNLLRLYVWFSAPMSEGCAAGAVRLVDGNGAVITGALLPTEHELWDGTRRRLTVLLDPARIKRGLAAHRAIGYPLQAGEPFWLEIDSDFRDAQGQPLKAAGRRQYQVGGDERRHVDPRAWTLTPPRSGTLEPVRAGFDRSLDHGLLTRCLLVTGPGGEVVAGTPQPGLGETSWQFTPSQAWTCGPHQVVVDPVLEDLAGNSVTRVFDRDLDRLADQPHPVESVTLTFSPR